ncbi:flagellar filament capping protein FliD [Thalassomonas actiniarum]|uniref:Flagellar hook-associated protein 2 n=1 Tax=Thalassomonas actiniarum TaxID=485447 RepID=A0AAE9YVT9_9GAMM|nr:flagellar filament capping protein FliD [Thalassomonas actiniarum]WDE00482.1 flagellar filament capping protein FliD [Thalassomonas actiniarum]
MAGISFPGVGSGLQVSEIVTAIVNAEKVPYQNRVTQKQAEFTTDISAIGSLKSALQEVNTSLEALGDADNYQQRTASGRDDFIGISSTKDAAVGNYSIEVDALASSHKLMSGAIDSSTPVGEGTMTIEIDGDSFDVVASATTTLSELRDLINDDAANDSVVATIITDGTDQHLVLNSKETGVSSEIKITVDDIDGNDTDGTGLSQLAYDALAATPVLNMTEVDKALDAQITIDGNVTVTSSTNDFKDAIDGVTITAKKVHDIAGGDDLSKATISEDNSNIATGINAFIESFNALVDLSDQLGKSEDGAVGALAGDSMLRNVMSKIRSQFTTDFETGVSSSGKTTYSMLAELGVRTERSGHLSLDSDTLDDLIDNDPNKIQNFFVGTDTATGFVESTEELLEFYTQSDGLIDRRIEGNNTQISKLEKDVEAFNVKMDALEARLYAQYNSMDTLVAQLNNTGSYITQQLDNMPGVVKDS